MTCDTLLSSQGAGAHLCEIFTSFWGNVPNLQTLVVRVKTLNLACLTLDLICSLSQDRPCLAHSHEDSVLANRRAAWCPLLPCDVVTIRRCV